MSDGPAGTGRRDPQAVPALKAAVRALAEAVRHPSCLVDMTVATVRRPRVQRAKPDEVALRRMILAATESHHLSGILDEALASVYAFEGIVAAAPDACHSESGVPGGRAGVTRGIATLHWALQRSRGRKILDLKLARYEEFRKAVEAYADRSHVEQRFRFVAGLVGERDLRPASAEAESRPSTATPTVDRLRREGLLRRRTRESARYAEEARRWTEAYVVPDEAGKALTLLPNTSPSSPVPAVESLSAKESRMDVAPPVLDASKTHAGEIVIRAAANTTVEALRGTGPGIDVLRKDSRRPVLYLRSFADDRRSRLELVGTEGSATGSMLVNRIPILAVVALVLCAGHALKRLAQGRSVRPSLEEELAEFFEDRRPFVAIGRPDEEGPPRGAARIYVPDHEWQAEVGRLMAISEMVLWQAGMTEATWLELAAIVRAGDPRRLVLILPGFDVIRRKRANMALPRPLPEDIVGLSACFVDFGDDWEPNVTPIELRPFFRRYMLGGPILDLESTLGWICRRSAGDQRASGQRAPSILNLNDRSGRGRE